MIMFFKSFFFFFEMHNEIFRMLEYVVLPSE